MQLLGLCYTLNTNLKTLTKVGTKEVSHVQEQIMLRSLMIQKNVKLGKKTQFDKKQHEPVVTSNMKQEVKSTEDYLMS